MSFTAQHKTAKHNVLLGSEPSDERGWVCLRCAMCVGTDFKIGSNQIATGQHFMLHLATEQEAIEWLERYGFKVTIDGSD